MIREVYRLRKIDKKSLFDGGSIGKFLLCVKKKPQQDVGLYLIRHFERIEKE